MIRTELERKENRYCAECYAPQPTNVSLNLGVFVCNKCFHFHKKLCIDKNCVVSVNTHKFTEEQIAFIKSRGNKVVNEKFEKYLPKYYHRPDFDDPPLIREQFIKAKYDRKEFIDISKQEGYSQGSKTGSLFKRGKDSDKFLHRKFVLHEPEGLLDYFIKFRDRIPKDTLVVRNLVNVYLAPEKVGNPNGMQITYEKDGTRRNLYVFGNDGKTTSDWYHALRASMVKHKYQTFPDDQMKRYLNTKIIKEGWMCKTGPKRQEKFRRRWFSLVGTMIWYYAQPLEAHPISYIPLGSKTFGYGVKKGLPKGTKEEGYGMTIHTPERVYALTCSDIETREEWVVAISRVLESCTTSWSPPVEKKQESDDKAQTKDNPSSFSTNSTKYRQSSGSDDSIDEIKKNITEQQNEISSQKTNQTIPAEKETSSVETDANKNLFQKNQKNPKKPPKYNKKASGKRISSTKKVTEKEYFRSDSDDESDKNKISESSDNELPQSQKNSDDTGDSDSVEITYQESLKSMNADHVGTAPRDHEIENRISTSPEKPPRQKAQIDPEISLPTKQINDGKDAEENVKKENIPATNKFAENNLTQKYSIKTKNSIKDKNITKDLFKKSLRRVEGQERASIKNGPPIFVPQSSSISVIDEDETLELKPRPMDVTLFNQVEESFWFLVFQSEEEIDEVESYITPWIGAKIAETPASIGPIHIPDEFEIAVIDTAPGGFGLQRTTGPFFAQMGDVWEVEFSEDEAEPPEMFFHEGMETEDGSVMIYSNHNNDKNFDVAIFKSKRKLLSRKNIKPGEAVSIRVCSKLHFLKVDKKTYFEVQGEDVRASEWIQQTSTVEINYKQSKMKVFYKKIGDVFSFA